MQHLKSAARLPAQAPLAGWMSRSSWIRRSAAILLTLAAPFARRDALAAIPVSLGIWALTGLSVVFTGLQLGYTGLAKQGIVLVVASVIGAAAGILLAARRGQASRSSPGAAELSPQTQPSPAMPAAPGPDAT
jgi:hypothetical protein